MLATWKLSPHSFSKSKLETVGPFSSFLSIPSSSKKNTMPSLSANSSNQSGELQGPSKLWKELANQILWIVLPSGSPWAPGISFMKLGAARFSRTTASLHHGTRNRTQKETRLRRVVSKTTAPLQVTSATLSLSKTGPSRLVPARHLRAAKYSHSPLAIRVHILCRNTPSAGRFDKYGTCFGDSVGQHGPCATCTRSPLASGQTPSLVVRDSGVFFRRHCKMSLDINKVCYLSMRLDRSFSAPNSSSTVVFLRQFFQKNNTNLTSAHQLSKKSNHARRPFIGKPKRQT